MVAAKALVGIAYTFASLGLLLAATRLSIADVPLFLAAVAVLTVGMVGFGLLLGGAFKTAGQAYTWSGFFLVPVIMPPFLLGSGLPDLGEVALLATPTAQATRVAANAITGKSVFGDVPLAFAVIVAWAVLAYVLGAVAAAP